MSTDAPLLLCWAVALYAFVRAREDGRWRWWLAVGVAGGLRAPREIRDGLLADLGAALSLALSATSGAICRAFLGAARWRCVIYAPNFVWNLAHGFVSYRHTEDNAALARPRCSIPAHFLEFFGSQFGVFGPLLFAALIGDRRAAAGARCADRRAALLAVFALPTLAMMLVVSFLSRASPTGRRRPMSRRPCWWWRGSSRAAGSAVVVASVALHVGAAVLLLAVRDIGRMRAGYDLPAQIRPAAPAARLARPWRRRSRGCCASIPARILLADDREDMAALLYYVRPHPLDALKWNGDDNLPRPVRPRRRRRSAISATISCW